MRVWLVFKTTEKVQQELCRVSHAVTFLSLTHSFSWHRRASNHVLTSSLGPCKNGACPWPSHTLECSWTKEVVTIWRNGWVSISFMYFLSGIYQTQIGPKWEVVGTVRHEGMLSTFCHVTTRDRHHLKGGEVCVVSASKVSAHDQLTPLLWCLVIQSLMPRVSSEPNHVGPLWLWNKQK